MNTLLITLLIGIILDLDLFKVIALFILLSILSILLIPASS